MIIAQEIDLTVHSVTSDAAVGAVLSRQPPPAARSGGDVETAAAFAIAEGKGPVLWAG